MCLQHRKGDAGNEGDAVPQRVTLHPGAQDITVALDLPGLRIVQQRRTEQGVLDETEQQQLLIALHRIQERLRDAG